MRYRKQTPKKRCEFCSEKLKRRRGPHNILESLTHFRKRRYCNVTCMGLAYASRLKDDITIHQGRQRARNLIYKELRLPKICELCGSLRFIDVHHIDMNPLHNVRENLLILCRSCHEKEHRKKGVCILCGDPLRARGYCAKHLTRWYRHGDPLLAWGKTEEIEEDEISEESEETS